MYRTKLTTIAATLSLMAAPGVALAAGADDHPTGPPATTPATAYGAACKGESKKHVAGQSGTPFSQCVTAMAKLDSGKSSNPTSACKALSKKHVAGQPGTPFSQCVKAAAKLKKSQATDPTTTDSAATPDPADERAASPPADATVCNEAQSLSARHRGTRPLRQTRCRPPATRARRCPSGREAA